MPEYLPKTKTNSGRLRRGEHLDVLFKVVNPGMVLIAAKASPTHFLDPTRRKIELFKPGATSPVASRTESGLGTVSLLKYNVPASQAGLRGNWTARVTNLEDTQEMFFLTVKYPGNIELKKFTVPVSVINSLVGATIKKIKIHVTNGANASYIRFPASLGIPEKRFTVPKFTYKINMPWPIPDIKINERVNDVNSKSVDFSLRNATAGFANGFMRFVVNFEESGKEILGTFHGHLSKMKLTIDLGFETQSAKISYNRNNVGVDFYCKVNLVSVPDWFESKVLDKFIGYTKKIRKAVEDAVRAIFASESMRSAFSNAITAKVSPLLGSNPKIVSVEVKAGKLTVRYYNA